MKLDFSWINILILFGALQGLIFAIILLFNKKHPGTKFLGVFMLVFAYNGVETFNWSAGLDQYIIFFDLFSFIVIFAAGPSLYLYIRSLLYPEQPVAAKTIAAHYSIVAFQFLYRAVIAILYAVWRINGANFEFAAPMMGIFWLYAEPLSVSVFLGYLVASIRLFKRADISENIRVISKDGQQVIRQWIRALLICMVVLGITWSVTVITPYFFDIPFGPHYYPIELALVVFIYWIAFAGHYRTRMIYFRAQPAPNNMITSSQAEQYMRQLREGMENNRLYLDPELNLDKVAGSLGISAKAISSTLNQHFQQSFSDFVNDYRVREVKEKLTSPQNSHLTISGIALESGFNSQATFQRAFKNITGHSPREYLNIQTKNNGYAKHEKTSQIRI